MRLSRAAAAFAALLVAALPAFAQQYPAKPVKIIVAFTAGGTSDLMARTVAARLTDRFKQPFVIENRPGAGGNLGSGVVCRAEPDGYTLLVNSVGPLAINLTLYKSLPCNPLTDLVPIAQISNVPNVLVVPSSLGIKTMEQFLAYAKKHPGEMNYGSTGIGTSSHLSSFMLASRGGFDATHIPYKGAEVVKDLITGRLQFMFATIPSVIGQIRGGTLTAIAVSSPYRSRSMPDVPTVAESGFPGFEAGSWFVLLAPKSTPQEVITLLNGAVNEIIAEKAVEKRLVDEGADPIGGSPEKVGAFIRSEYEKWRTVVRESGASAD
ncbi:MAG: Bug family tripartite tricarboxylate transporter substrate binding protein [Usitatibacter sp.]